MRGLLGSRLLILGLAAQLGACASLDLENYGQNIRIQSEPAGAEIYYEGEFQGLTPKIVRVDRKRSNTYTLKSSEGIKRSYSLEKSYRFIEAFVSNAIWGDAFLLGVGTDLTTGMAWHIKEPPVVRLPEHKDPGYFIDWVVAIAPPDSGWEELNDEIGRKVERELRRDLSEVSILPFDQTLPEFRQVQWTNREDLNEQSWVDLYADLGATHILRMETHQDKDWVIVKAELRDPFHVKPARTFSYSFPRSDFTFFKRSQWEILFYEGFQFLPNTLAVDLSWSWTQVNVDQFSGPIAATNEAPEGGLGKASRYIGAISLATLRPPIRVTRLQLKFQIAPSVQVVHDRIRLLGFPVVEDHPFERMRLSLGIGPQADLFTPLGIFYITLQPNFSWSRLSWEAQQRKRDEESYKILTSLEFGIYRYLSQRLAFRVFYRVSGEDKNLLQKAVREQTGQDFTISLFERYYAGFSLGLYLPEAQDLFRSITRRVIDSSSDSSPP